jgi:Cu+-exporting ATPase
MAARKVFLRVEGMHCASCVQRVEKILLGVGGVRSASVNLASCRASVEFEEELFPMNEARERAQEAGYGLFPEAADALAREEELARAETAALRAQRRRALLAWAFTGPAMLVMAAHMTGALPWHALMHPLVMTALAAPAVLWAGKEVLHAGLGALRRLSPHMDSLIAVGALAALATGPAAVFSRQAADFSAVGGMIMAFHLLGRFIETASRGRASQAIRALARRGAKEARVMRGREWASVPAGELQKGDRVRVKPGEKIPADGKVLAGEGAVDESLVTGESMPVLKHPGEAVTGGTVNMSGSLEIEVTRVGAESFLARMTALVEACQGGKVPVQAFADSVAARFVPAVFALSLATFAGWLAFHERLAPLLGAAAEFLPWTPQNLPPISMALYAAVAVLVAACPCALGLATPMALMAASGLGAQKGILIRRGEAIERMKNVRVFALDKTGTLTVGKPAVTDRVAVADVDPDGLLRLAASAEAPSEHPLAAAMVESAKAKGLSLAEARNFRAEAGLGVRAIVEGKEVLAGSAEFLAREGVPGLDAALAAPLEDEAKSVVFVAAEKTFLGVVALRDELKEGAAEAVAALHAMGYGTLMLTGDSEGAARALAREAGIGDVRARVLPHEKAEAVRGLQAEAGAVAMAGDGLNDAPALAQADIGIAMGAGTDVAIESSAIILTSGDMRALTAAVRLAREAFAVIRQNLWWAFGYNLVVLPLAMAGMLHPVMAEVCMAASSLSVAANSLRLKRMKF